MYPVSCRKHRGKRSNLSGSSTGALGVIALLSLAMGVSNSATAAEGFSVESISVAEDVGVAEIIVTLSNPVQSDTTVSISSSPDTAINGQDFFGFYKNLEFSAGETSQTVSVFIIDDEDEEQTESLSLRLFNNTKELTEISNGSASISIEDNDSDEPDPGGIWSPAPGTSWQWQLTGQIDTSFDVDMYDIDLFDVPQSVINELQAAGRKVVCYFSAGSYEDWRPDASQFPEAVKGDSNGWPGERWLDIRRLDLLGPIMSARLDRAAERGCDGVEPDNIDAYTNSTGFPLNGDDQIRYNVWLSEQAHARGLAIGLKNDVDQVEELEPYFDFAINEQCNQYNECGRLTPFVEARKAVFGVEYQGSLSSFCPEMNALDFDWLKKNLNLGAEREACR